MRSSWGATPALFAGARRSPDRRRHLTRRRRHRPRARLDRPACTSPPARSTRPARCSRRATTPRSTTGSSSASPAPRRSARRPVSARSTAMADDRASAPRRGARQGRARDLLDAFVEHVRSFVDVGAAATAEGRRRHRQRHGWARRAGGVRGPAVHAQVLYARARRHVPEPPGRPDPAGEPARPPARRARAPAPTSGSRSTATPTACSSSTSTADACQRLDHHRADRGGDAGARTRARRSSTT